MQRWPSGWESNPRPRESSAMLCQLSYGGRCRDHGHEFIIFMRWAHRFRWREYSETLAPYFKYYKFTNWWRKYRVTIILDFLRPNRDLLRKCNVGLPAGNRTRDQRPTLQFSNRSRLGLKKSRIMVTRYFLHQFVNLCIYIYTVYIYSLYIQYIQYIYTVYTVYIYI